MSVRAYKVIKITRKKEPTFNCWRDTFLFYDELVDTRYFNDGGFIEVEKYAIEEAIKSKDYEGEELEILKLILKDFPKNEDYLLYDCY